MWHPEGDHTKIRGELVQMARNGRDGCHTAARTACRTNAKSAITQGIVSRSNTDVFSYALTPNAQDLTQPTPLAQRYVRKNRVIPMSPLTCC